MRSIIWICCENGDEGSPLIASELLLSDDCEGVFVKQGDGSLGRVQPDEVIRQKSIELIERALYGVVVM